MNEPTQKLTLPYPGLRPFDEADHALFFGRHEQSNQLLMRLEDSAFVAVVGSSGSGKSSLVRAGLLPLIRRGFLFGTENWHIAVARPGHEPYERLARKLSDGQSSVDTDEILATLHRSDRGLLEAIDLVCSDPEAHVLVVIDQFEELFGFRRGTGSSQQSRNHATREEAGAFVSLLLTAARHAGDRLRIMLTMRSDFVGECEAFLGLPAAVSNSQFLVPRLTRSQMEAAIVRPGQIRNADFQPFDIESGLVTTLINDAGDRPDQLPLLQHALMRTWKRSDRQQLTVQNYRDAGRIAQALSNDADAAWKSLGSERLKEVARHLFLLLCDVSPEGQITRRRPVAQEVIDVAGASCQEIEQVVRTFQNEDRNFLLPPAPEPIKPETVLDISHESLLRQWTQLQKWLVAEAEAVAVYRWLKVAVTSGVKTLDKVSLNRAIEWRTKVDPQPAWAARYGDGGATRRSPDASLLDRCLTLIDESEMALAAEQVRQYREQEKHERLEREAREAEQRRL
jgi:energy-coupling factor transporter ATP-binding protein EcfA2